MLNLVRSRETVDYRICHNGKYKILLVRHNQDISISHAEPEEISSIPVPYIE